MRRKVSLKELEKDKLAPLSQPGIWSKNDFAMAFHKLGYSFKQD